MFRVSFCPCLGMSGLLRCLRAAALATGCEVKITQQTGTTFDLRQNKALGEKFFGP